MTHACMICNLVVLEGENSCFKCLNQDIIPCTVTEKGDVNQLILERHEEGFFCNKCGSYTEGDQCCGFHFREPHQEEPSEVYITQERDEEMEALKRTIAQLQQTKDESDEALLDSENARALLQQELRKTQDLYHDTKTELLRHMKNVTETFSDLLNKYENH